jgi:hypothetical protein
VIHRNQKLVVPLYHLDTPLDQGVAGFTSLATMEKKAAEATVDDEIGRCVGSIQRARGVTAVLDKRFPGLSDRLDRVLEELVLIRREVLKAA